MRGEFSDNIQQPVMSMRTSLDGEADAMKMEFGMACTYVLGV